MKYDGAELRLTELGRPPHGGRGLKSEKTDRHWEKQLSPPARGAWVEIGSAVICVPRRSSPPARGAWVEIRRNWSDAKIGRVAPRTGGVG